MSFESGILSVGICSLYEKANYVYLADAISQESLVYRKGKRLTCMLHTHTHTHMNANVHVVD